MKKRSKKYVLNFQDFFGITNRGGWNGAGYTIKKVNLLSVDAIER